MLLLVFKVRRNVEMCEKSIFILFPKKKCYCPIKIKVIQRRREQKTISSFLFLKIYNERFNNLLSDLLAMIFPHNNSYVRYNVVLLWQFIPIEWIYFYVQS